MKTLLVVEGNPILRSGIQFIANQTEEFCCPTTLSNYNGIKKILKNNEYDIILFDTDISSKSAVEYIKYIKENYSQIHIIALSSNEEHQFLYKVLNAGACGFVDHNITPTELMDAVKEVCAGGAPLSFKAAKYIREYVLDKENPKSNEPNYDLTCREKELLGDLINGSSMKLISRKYSITIDTVRYHFKNIFRKLKVRNQAELVAKVLREHII